MRGFVVEQELEHPGQPGFPWQYGLEGREPCRMLEIERGSGLLYAFQADLKRLQYCVRRHSSTTFRTKAAGACLFGPLRRLDFGTLLLRQCFVAGVFRQAASVLNAGLLVVTRNGIERWLDHRLLHHVFARD